MCIVRERPHPDSREALQSLEKCYPRPKPSASLKQQVPSVAWIHPISTLVLEDDWGTWKGFRLNSDMLTEKCPSKVGNVALVSIPRGGDLAQLIFNVLHTLGIPSCPELSLDSWFSYLKGLSME